MTIRITTSKQDSAMTIRVEGRLDLEAVPDLQEAVKFPGAPLRLDLSGLMSADAEGIKELRSLSAKGAELRGASTYIRQLLDATSS
jgi:anti-anti-sigma regulatory factor